MPLCLHSYYPHACSSTVVKQRCSFPAHCTGMRMRLKWQSDINIAFIHSLTKALHISRYTQSSPSLCLNALFTIAVSAFLQFRASVLKPRLHLGLSKKQSVSQAGPLRQGHILLVTEGVLKLCDLLCREHCPRLAALHEVCSAVPARRAVVVHWIARQLRWWQPIVCKRSHVWLDAWWRPWRIRGCGTKSTSY